MKKKIKKIFIIGSRGSLTKQIIKKLENKFSLTKISRKNIDVVLNFKKLKKIIDKLNPDLIINCIGVTKFLDYSTLDLQEDVLDLFLMEKAKFFIGTQSGILDLAQLFNKPILQTNMIAIFSKYPFKKNDRGIFRSMKKNNEFLSITDFIKLNYEYHNPSHEIDDLIFYENTEEQIYDSLREFLDIQQNPILTKDQKKFNEFLSNEHKLHYSNNPNQLFTEYDSLKVARLVKNNEGCLTNLNLKNFNFN
jgi:ADP-heptose:LPS heptosyltransferase|tara:strand:+ start:935 stop:1681 length:747 start_codon:yes stop_codon:yes gene_type:complete